MGLADTLFLFKFLGTIGGSPGTSLSSVSVSQSEPVRSINSGSISLSCVPSNEHLRSSNRCLYQLRSLRKFSQIVFNVLFSACC